MSAGSFLFGSVSLSDKRKRNEQTPPAMENPTKRTTSEEKEPAKGERGKREKATASETVAFSFPP